MEQGEIYIITSPSGKQYIGQCVKKLPNGRRHGYISRWKQHIYEAISCKNYCVALDNALRKYNYNGFNIELLHTCFIEDLNHWEKHFIKHYNTIHPFGYNLTEGGSNGRQSATTCEKKRQSMQGKNKGKQYPKRTRLYEEDNSLPKYIRHYRDNSGKEGYRISNHPSLKDKSFLSKTLSMEQKLNLAKQYINTSNSRERFNE